MGRVELGESSGLVDLNQTGHPWLPHDEFEMVEFRSRNDCNGNDWKDRTCNLHNHHKHFIISFYGMCVHFFPFTSHFLFCSKFQTVVLLVSVFFSI